MKQMRAMKPDAQAFDNIVIRTEPRYKQSDLSGDEWRISAVVELYRKGKKVHEFYCRNVETACYLLGAEHLKAVDDGKGYFAGEEDICDQEGCEWDAAVTYKLKNRYCREGHKSEAKVASLGEDGIVVRKFCDEHKRRGDCGLEDADDNYEVVP
jgi:hypothetical protein